MNTDKKTSFNINTELSFSIIGDSEYFYEDIPCKIIKTFNGGRNMDEKFRDYQDKEKLLIVLKLNTRDNIKYDYYLCKKSNLVVFYHIERLKLFINKLNQNGFYYTQEEILEMPSIYNHKKPIIETLIIAMLYGNIYPCHSQYNEKSYNINDNMFEENIELRALKRAYLSFIESKINNKTQNRVRNGIISINSIQKRRNKNLKEEENERIRQNAIRQQILLIKERIENSTGPDHSKENKKNLLNIAIQKELYKKQY